MQCCKLVRIWAERRLSGTLTAAPEPGHLLMSQLQSARAARGLTAAAREMRVAMMTEAFILMFVGSCYLVVEKTVGELVVQ